MSTELSPLIFPGCTTWKAEIQKRCREIDEGAIRLVDAEEAFAKAYARVTS